MAAAMVMAARIHAPMPITTHLRQKVSLRLACPRNSYVADRPADLLIPGITGRVPEPSRGRVIEGHEGSHATDSTAAQIVLASAGQSDPDALSAAGASHRKSIHVPPPPIPASDQRPNDLSLALGHQEGSWGV